MVKKAGQKRKKAEKAKTQLKTSGKPQKKGRKIRGKGANETKFDVKTRVITLQKTQEAVPSTTSTLETPVFTGKLPSLKENTHRLTNTNATVRLEAIRALIQLMRRRHELPALLEITSFLPKILPILSDSDRDVRTEVGKLLRVLMEESDDFQTEPVQRLMTAHLCCSLSHIDSSVARQTLKVLDSVIELCPDVVEQSFDRIVTATLAQLGQKEKSQSSGGAATSGPSFSGTLDQKVSHNEWRLAVLTRLDQLLSIAGRKSSLVTLPKKENEVTEWGVRPFQGLFPTKSYYQSGMTLLDVLSPFRTSDLTTSDGSGSILITRKIIGLLSEVLSEIESGSWNERGGMDASNFDATLEDSLARVASVLYHLERTYVKEGLSYPPMFVEQLLNAYPFSFVDKSKELTANLMLGSMMLQQVDPHSADYEKTSQKLSKIVQDSLSGKLLTMCKDFHLLESVLKTLLKDERTNCDELSDAFIKALLHFNNEESLSKIVVQLLKQNCLGSQRICPWIKTLKKESMNDFEAQAITILRKRNQLPNSMLVES